jgi:hypothetical protein
MEKESRHLLLPTPGTTPSSPNSVESKGPLVIIGANGSGKTRLGSWIELESAQQSQVRRISAQKSLNLPAFAASTSIDRAESDLFYGYVESDRSTHHKRLYRWQQNPNTSLLSDYDKLLTYLFSEANETHAQYVQEQREETTARIEPPKTKLNTTQRIWEEVLPHRKLVIGGGKIETTVTDGSGATYNAAEMSDGERVVFYLIGQALSAPSDGIIVIDEPELHLHRSIQAILWDKIEAERSDCLFVYLTHDLDFAASRVTATKVCLRGFDGSMWDWYIVPENNEIPEETFLEILGSRKPIIFVEGDKGSLDYFLYQKSYPGYTIAPSGGASEVIHAARTFSSFQSLHRHRSYGIIDRDFRDEDEVRSLEVLNVSVLKFSEIENVLLTEEVLRVVAKHLHRESDFPSLLEGAKNVVFRETSSNQEQLISSITASKVERALKNYDAKARGKEALKSALTTLMTSIEVDTLYEATATDIDGIISSRDYVRALRIYNNKGLLPQIAPLFGFTYPGFIEFLKRHASSDEGNDLITALQGQVPSIPT